MASNRGSLTKTEERVLRKASKQPVARAGAFGGGDQSAAQRPDFDRPLLIDRCIARGLLAPTDWFNKYAITAEGSGRLRSLDEKRAARAAKQAT